MRLPTAPTNCTRCGPLTNVAKNHTTCTARSRQQTRVVTLPVGTFSLVPRQVLSPVRFGPYDTIIDVLFSY